MSLYRILIYEDETLWKNAFEYNIKPKVALKGKELTLIHRTNNSTIMQDLESLPDLIMVDYDLITLTGDEIIEHINGDPNFNKVKIYFYSGGESIETLKGIAQKYQCSISCFAKDSTDLEMAILKLI